MRSKDALGKFGEELAAAHLERLGMVLLDRNWRCEVGELDLVARHDDDLVICEVKTRRTSNFGDPAEAISTRKLKKLRECAYLWLVEKRVHPSAIRFDVVAIVQPWEGAPILRHIKGV